MKAVNMHARFTQIVTEKVYVIGPATAKVWRPYVSSWNLGTTSRWRLAEQRCCRSATWATGVHSSDR